MKRKVAMSVPKACTAPTRRSLSVIFAQSAALATAVGTATATPALVSRVAAGREAHPPTTSSRLVQ
jgi:hypothetical protein